MKRWSYWAELAFRVFKFIVIASVVYGFIMSFSASDSFKVQNWMALSFSYGILMYLLITTASNSGKFISVANITLSMGDTRRNALIGINVFNSVGLVCITAVSLIVALASGGEIVSVFDALITASCLYILAAGLGLCCSTMSQDSSSVIRGFQLVFMFVCITAVFAAAFFTGMLDGMAMDFFNGKTGSFLASYRTVALIITAIAGIAFYIMGNIRMNGRLSVLEVRL